MLEGLSLSKIFFLHNQYLWHVFLASIVTFFLYLFWSLRIWRLYKHFGGYNNCKKQAKQSKTSLLGPFKIMAKVLVMTFLALLIGLSLLEPSIKEHGEENQYEPSQIVVSIDSTLSMLAEDIKPSRIEAAKTEVYNLIERVKREGGKDKIALYRFTDIAIPAVVVPTQDYDILNHEIGRITKGFLGRFKTHGTNIWDSITQGLKSFTSDDQIKILIIITDGEQATDDEHLDKTRQEAIELRNRNEDVKIFIVSIGTIEEEPSLIPKVKDESGNVLEFYTQEAGPDEGKFIETRPDKQYIEEVCSQINCKPIVPQSGKELSKELDTILTEERKVIGVKESPKFKNITPQFIIASLLLMLFMPLAKI